jgi:hypothetical protein
VLDCSQGLCVGTVQLSCSQNHQITVKRLTIQSADLYSVVMSNHGCKLRLIDSAVLGEGTSDGIVHQGRGTLTIRTARYPVTMAASLFLKVKPSL